MSFFGDFFFRGSYAELLRRYPGTNFEIRDINGREPSYRLSYRPTGSRMVSLRTETPDDGDWSSLTRLLKSPERLKVVDITLP